MCCGDLSRSVCVRVSIDCTKDTIFYSHRKFKWFRTIFFKKTICRHFVGLLAKIIENLWIVFVTVSKIPSEICIKPNEKMKNGSRAEIDKTMRTGKENVRIAAVITTVSQLCVDSKWANESGCDGNTVAKTSGVQCSMLGEYHATTPFGIIVTR